MKGLKAVAMATKGINWDNRIPLYYSIEKQTVYTKDRKDRCFVTWLINECTEKDIEKAVNRWLNM